MQVRGTQAGRQTRARRRARLEPYVWIAPGLLLYTVFILVAVIVNFWMGFVRWDGITAPVGVGFQNFVNVFHDSRFWSAMKIGAEFSFFSVLLKLALSLVLAVLLNRAWPGRGAMRVIVFLPCVIAPVLIGMMFNYVLDYSQGLVNGILGSVGLGALKHNWLGQPETALGSIIAVDAWRWTGFQTVILLAGLQSIPADLYEVAKIDGANVWTAFWRITLPLLMPVIMIVVVLSEGGGFNLFDLPYVMTAGGPNLATNTPTFEIYTQVFQFNQFGYGAAEGVVLFFVIAALVLVTLRFLRSERYF
jgi:raffinose/stachyose/melibiose transport system permease protein